MARSKKSKKKKDKPGDPMYEGGMKIRKATKKEKAAKKKKKGK